MSRIYLTGDIHREISRFNGKNFPEQKGLTRDDYVIVLGDFGLIGECGGESKSEKHWLDWLQEKSFTLLFVDGNHENFDRLCSDEYPIVDFHGGKAHKIRENVYHLMRGYVFELHGKKFFAFGGAASHDVEDGIFDPADFSSEKAFKSKIRILEKLNKHYRIKNVTWWERELPNDEEMARGRESLSHNNWTVDYVITHCLPQEIALLADKESYGSDILTRYFDELLHSGLQFKSWWCGHYHCSSRIMDRFNILNEEMVLISDGCN